MTGWGQGIKSTTHRRVNEFGYSCCQRHLTCAKEKKNWTVAQWSKVLFSDESKFCISFGNQGPRVWRKGGEAHCPSCLKSSVKFPQSVMIWGVMSSAGVGPLCFLKTNVSAPIYQDFLEHFMLPSADQLFKDDFIIQQDLAPAHTAKSTKSWLNDHVLVSLTGHQTHQTWTPSRINGVLSKGKWETRDQKIQMSWRPLSKKPGLPYHLSSATNWSPPCHAELRQYLKQKEPLPSIEYIYSKWTLSRRPTIHKKNCIFIGLMKYSNLLRIGGFLLNVSQYHHN